MLLCWLTSLPAYSNESISDQIAITIHPSTATSDDLYNAFWNKESANDSKNKNSDGTYNVLPFLHNTVYADQNAILQIDSPLITATQGDKLFPWMLAHQSKMLRPTLESIKKKILGGNKQRSELFKKIAFKRDGRNRTGKAAAFARL
ncbi:MAG: hypothetical protein HQK53_10060 [Oligoflexia bacterium]|nr:hypothetical protein [Oligoflexia bacterium]